MSHQHPQVADGRIGHPDDGEPILLEQLQQVGGVAPVSDEIVAYALFRETEAEVYLRQFFVVRHRRREGIRRRAIAELFANVWPKNKRLTVSVLAKNVAGVAFWRSMGYTDYDLTLEIMPEARPTPNHGMQPTAFGRG